MYTLRLFGSVAVEGPAGPLSGHAAEPRQLAVLAMLACAGRDGISRDKLLACLWPDADAVSARHSLSDATYRLRKELGREAILGGSAALRLNPDVLRTDVVDFERAVEEGDPATAAAVYRGPFLDGFHGGHSIEFEHWRDGEARRLEQRFQSVLETLADRADAAGDHGRAAEFLRRLLALDPYNSRTVLRLMEALAAGADPANAIKLAEEHRAFLAAELGVEPPAELLALVERLRCPQNGGPAAGPAGGAALRAQRSPANVPAHAPDLAGREAELTRLHGFFDEAATSVHDARPARPRLPLAGMGAVVITGIALVLIFRGRPGGTEIASASGPAEFTILAEVEGNAPADLRSTMGSLLTDAIDASGMLQTLPGSQIQLGLERARKPDTTRLTVPVAVELAGLGLIGTVMAPTLDRVGTTWALTLRVLRADRDSTLFTHTVTADSDDALIPASLAVVDSLMPELRSWLARQVRPRRGEPALTSSLAAYQKAQEGWRAVREQARYRDAIRLFREALEIDPEYAYAWYSIGSNYANVGINDSARLARLKALELPDRLNERHRLFLNAWIADDPVAILEWHERSYRETGVALNDHAMALTAADRVEEAVTIWRAMEEQRPFGLEPAATANRHMWLLALRRVEEAESVAGHLATHPFAPFLAMARASVRGEWDTAEGLALEVALNPVNDRVWSEAVLALASARGARGQVRSAFSRLEHRMSRDRDLGRERASTRSHLDGLVLAVASEQLPQDWPLAALRADTTQLARALSGLWAIQSGDTALAKALLSTLPASEPDELVRVKPDEAIVATLRARIAGERNRWSDAVRHLRKVTGHRAPMDSAANYLPHWVLAHAEEQSGNLEAAAHLFAGIGEGLPGGRDEILAGGLARTFARRRAALLFGRLGDRDRAVEQWLHFLDDFTEPDPDLERLAEEARQQLAALQGAADG